MCQTTDQSQTAATWTFSTSGWLFTYFFGVIKALREQNALEHRDVYAIGSSGGALAGGLLFVPELSIDDMVNFIGDCCDDCRSSIWNRFKVREYVRQAIHKFCPDDIAQRVTGKLEVSVTQVRARLLAFRNIRWKEFASKEEYVDAILASSCAVGIAGLPYFTKKYGWSVDGGFTDLDLIRAIAMGTKFCKFHNGQVTSVCPFYWSRADIRPSRFVNPLWALLPPPRKDLMALYKLGYDDTITFLETRSSESNVEAVVSPWDSLNCFPEDCIDIPRKKSAGKSKPRAKDIDTQKVAEEAMKKLQDGASCAHEEARKNFITTRQLLGSLGPLAVGRSAVKAAAWQMVYLEVILVTYIASALFWVLLFMPKAQRDEHAQRNWKRALFCWGGLVDHRLLLKMLPVVSCHIDLDKQVDPRFVSSLQEVSLSYRLFKHHL